MRIINDPKLDFDDVLITPKRSTLSSRKSVVVERTFKMKWTQQEWTGVPIFAANMDSVGVTGVADVLKKSKLPTALHKHYTEVELIQMFTHSDPYLWYSLGITDDDYNKLVHVNQYMERNKGDTVKYLCVDIANGYTEGFVNFITRLRKEFPGAVIMAGNVVTPEITEQLILAGADIVKVGIGPGSVCTTRKMTGVGYPQLSAIIECADAAHGLGGLICGDGGCKVPGDVVKAFGGGADFVMLGGMFAGHLEGGGTIIDSEFRVHPELYWNRPPVINPGMMTCVSIGRPKEAEFGLIGVEINKSYAVNATEFALLIEDSNANAQTKFKRYDKMLEHYKKFPWAFAIEKTARIQFYGMSSDAAQEKHSGGVASYKASEGKVVMIPYKGLIAHTVQDILGGLRSACTYVGATSLKQLSKRTTFVMVNRQLNPVFNAYE